MFRQYYMASSPTLEVLYAYGQFITMTSALEDYLRMNSSVLRLLFGFTLVDPSGHRCYNACAIPLLAIGLVLTYLYHIAHETTLL